MVIIPRILVGLSALGAIILALGLWLAESCIDGIYVDKAATLLLAGFLLGIVNALVISTAERKRELGVLRALGGEVLAPGKGVLAYGKADRKFKNPSWRPQRVGSW